MNTSSSNATASNSSSLRVYKTETGVETLLESVPVADIGKGEVLIRVEYSGINYKDALAVTGKGQIMKNFPLIAGIDLAGEVVESGDIDFKVGDKVLANGSGLGEVHDGGLSQYARIPAKWTIPLPAGLTTREAMIIGTAGFTAAMALYRMEVNGQNPAMGPVVVTGASGGVGSFAVNILANQGYQVIAVSGRDSQFERLTALGARDVKTIEQLNLGTSPLQKAQFGGAIDNIGGNLLSQLIASTTLWGNVASIGLADSPKLNAAVFPFILRGVSLLGISSTNCPMIMRKALWERLGDDLKPTQLESFIFDEVGLDKVVYCAEELLNRQRHGRTIVNCN